MVTCKLQKNGKWQRIHIYKSNISNCNNTRCHCRCGCYLRTHAVLIQSTIFVIIVVTAVILPVIINVKCQSYRFPFIFQDPSTSTCCLFPFQVPSPSSSQLDMVEVIAGLNAVSNAANSDAAGNEPSIRRRISKAFHVAETATPTRSSTDVPSFDDSIEYPVVGRDDILRACVARAVGKDVASSVPRSSSGDRQVANNGSEKRRGAARGNGKRRVDACFCPDPAFTISFER